MNEDGWFRLRAPDTSATRDMIAIDAYDAGDSVVALGTWDYARGRIVVHAHAHAPRPTRSANGPRPPS